ncbi:4-hydroxy-3-methylbut-2-enyl diphosphate reductase [Roseospira navarrensis]|uniref:4-hydroxy-3-methylbut-2-enyl diphosphate reductase n=1 Tax=Roseospira navarrensis TaxID=140058 RepID=A0A7X2D4B4_9PROT|nr:4-hydroxy-3-methylbut-2-enyl diphosphate reductase [Roseospira navarrensis]MQX36457.1 4-hydroxy-3-methylbut-2-enyl diphosphate reductase [Roseospira navarrensis]
MPSALRVILASPRGFCAGVERAIEIVERALEIYGPPVYVRHEIVHNKHVVETLRRQGAVFVEELHEVPDGAMTVFSAHGVPQLVVKEAERRALPVIDATCPLVSKVHREGQNLAAKGREIIMIGHEGHPEVEGTRGQIPGGVHLVSRVEDVEKLQVRDPEMVGYVTQTTLSVDDTREVIAALKRRFPGIKGPGAKDICYATQNRQTAVRLLAEQVDLLLVVGARNSSNSNRLAEIGTTMGVPSYLIDDATMVQDDWFRGVSVVGVTAGASAPESLVRDLVARIGEVAPATTETTSGIEEHMQFKLPRVLTDAMRDRGIEPDDSRDRHDLHMA